MSKRSVTAEYMLGGAFEAAAKQGVADAIADLKAAGIEPVYISSLKKAPSIEVVDHRHPPELVKQAATVHPEVIRASMSHAALSRGASR